MGTACCVFAFVLSDILNGRGFLGLVITRVIYPAFIPQCRCFFKPFTCNVFLLTPRNYTSTQCKPLIWLLRGVCPASAEAELQEYGEPYQVYKGYSIWEADHRKPDFFNCTADPLGENAPIPGRGCHSKSVVRPLTVCSPHMQQIPCHVFCRVSLLPLPFLQVVPASHAGNVCCVTRCTLGVVQTTCIAPCHQTGEYRIHCTSFE